MKTVYGLEIPTTLEDVCNRRSMALLVYDMQIGIVSQIADSQYIAGKVKEALDAARAAGMRIIFTRHLSLPKEMMGATQYRTAMAWQHVDAPEDVRPWFLRDSPGFPIVSDLAPLSSEAIFDKITMSAFEGTPLPIALRDCGIKAVAITGIAMEVGIEPTARHAADLGFIPVILADACGYGHKNAALGSLECLRFSGDSMITDVNTFCALLQCAE
jgi:nicotinamidase-related amidase